MRKLALTLSFILFAGISAFGNATPTFVQSCSAPSGQGNAGTQYDLRCPNTVLSGNALIVTVQNASGASPSSVTDDSGANTYTQLGTGCDDANQIITAWIALNITNAPRVISVHWASGKAFEMVHAEEWRNIVTSSPGDGTACGHTTGTAMSSGAVGNAGATSLILNILVQDGTSNAIDRFTNGSNCGGFTLQSADVIDSMAVQSAVTSSACTADATLSASLAYISYAVGIKSSAAAQGTAPSATAIRVVRDQHHNFNIAGTSPYKIQFPGTGGANTAFIIRWIGSPSMTITTASMTGGGTWVECGAAVQNGGSGVAQIVAVFAPTGSNTLQISVPWTSGPAVGSNLQIMEVQNITNDTCVEAHATGNMTVGTTLSTTSITPNTNAGLVVSDFGCANPTVIGENAPYVFLSAILTPTPATSPVDENNEWGLVYTSDQTAKSQVVNSSAALGVWAVKLAYFNQSASAGGGAGGGGLQLLLGP